MSQQTKPGDLPLPELLDPARLSAAVREPYHNRSLTQVNDHEVRMSVMTERFRWHHHPDSDEMFIVVEGGLIIEFDDREVLLHPGQIMAVPRGVRHRTRPEGARSVNLTLERRGTATVFDEQV
ncbi:MAG: cupin domain-containing protein [Chthoniobacterales bacterium]